jgi:hypothetical protein
MITPQVRPAISPDSKACGPVDYAIPARQPADNQTKRGLPHIALAS